MQLWRYITMLGTRMQYGMDLNKTTATLREEFQYVQDYFTLQEVRFGSGIQLAIALSPEAENLIVPKMILQPLAENAFKHGQLCRRPGLHFFLSAQIQNGNLEIISENDGMSCPPERMAELNRDLECCDQEIDGIGLLNVVRRLRIFFGQEVKMQLEKPESEGFRVQIRMPLNGTFPVP